MLATIDTLELTTTQAEALFDAGYCAWNDSPERVTFWHRDTGVAPTVTFSHAGDGFVYQVNESGPWFGAEDADVRHALIAWMVAAGQR